MGGVETRLAWRWAWKVQAEMVAAAVETLKGLGGESLLSGDDSGLENLWEEICAQVQGEESIYWEVYEDAIDQYVSAEFKKRSLDEQLVVWLQTAGGCDWLSNNEGEDPTSGEVEDLLKRGYNAVSADEVAENLRRDVLEAAGEFTKKKLDRYIFGPEEGGDSEDDEDEDES